MSEVAVARPEGDWPGNHSGVSAGTWPAPDTRRLLQLALGALWLLDAILQAQSGMFTRAFGQMLAESAPGNPALVAHPISWNAGLIAQHGMVTNALFAAIQLLLGLGIAWRRTVRVALGASIIWSLGVWWLGEGLGGVLTPTASPVTGAPGAVIIYALLAVLLWPRDGDSRPGPFVAAQAVGAPVARALWLLLWGSLAYFAVLPANRAPQALASTISGVTDGEPGWLSSIGHGADGLLAGQGLLASVLLASAVAVVAVGVYLPRPAARGTILLAVVLAAVTWVVGQALGEVLTGMGTDPGTGPLLILLAAAYWPTATTARPAATAAHPATPSPAVAATHGPGRTATRGPARTATHGPARTVTIGPALWAAASPALPATAPPAPPAAAPPARPAAAPLAPPAAGPSVSGESRGR